MVDDFDGDEEDLIPRRHGHPDNRTVTVHTVRAGYENLIRGINKANKVLPEDDRFHVPFGVQEALALWIAEQEALMSLKGEADAEVAE